jgi:hypothetical protein
MDRTTELCVELALGRVEDQPTKKSVEALSDLELAFVGGGIGNTIL